MCCLPKQDKQASGEERQETMCGYWKSVNNRVGDELFRLVQGGDN